MSKHRVGRSRPRAPGLFAATFILGLVALAADPAPAQQAGDPPDPATFGTRPIGLGRRSGSPGFFGVAYASIFGASDQDPWRALTLRTFFTEGWDEPWIAQPDGSGDAQQGWIDAADGSFYRLHFLSYNFTRGLARAGNGNTGSYVLYTPLSRRLEIITSVPFVTSRPTLNLGRQTLPNQGPAGPKPTPRTTAGFGDLTITPRVLLIEEDLYSAVAQLAVQTPTGYRPVGAGQTILSPGLQFWANVSEGWVVRGGFSANVGTNRAAGRTSLLSQLAVGRVLTPHDTPLIGDLTLYLSANVLNRLNGPETTVTLTPGLRSHLGNDWYFLAGIEVPVSGPRPFAEGLTTWIMKVF